MLLLGVGHACQYLPFYFFNFILICNLLLYLLNFAYVVSFYLFFKAHLEKEIAIYSSILAWKIPWTEEPGRLQSTGSQRVRHNRATSLSLSPSLHNTCPSSVWLRGFLRGISRAQVFGLTTESGADFFTTCLQANFKACS